MVLPDNDDDYGRNNRMGTPVSASPRTSKHHRNGTRSMFLPLFVGFQRPRKVPVFKDRSRDGNRDRDREKEREREREREAIKNTPSRHRDHERGRERDTDRGKHHHRHRRHSSEPVKFTKHPTRPTTSPNPFYTTHSAPAPAPPPPPPRAPRPVRVELKSLDPGQYDWTVLIRDGYPVMKLEAHIRHNLEKKGRRLDPAALFRFFAPDAREFTQEDKVTADIRHVWYRVSRFSGQVESWKFTHYRDDTHGQLDSAFTEELVRDIEAGATVKQLRRKIAEKWDIEDANRIVLIAKGGFRPGSIKGEDWEIRQVKEKWLCRWIAIDVCQRKRYIVLKGLKREYILHPDWCELSMAEVKTVMCDKVFRGVRQHGRSNFNLAPRRVILTMHDGEAVRNRDRLVWGAEYTFELPVHDAEVFSNEETWLLPATETCMICVDDKKITELPIRITAECKHEPTTCKACLDQWLQSSLESGSWDRLKCPECDELLKHADVHRYASTATFSRYDDLATRAVLKDMPNFRWCLSTTCTSGQIDDETCAKFKCKECKTSHCIRHNVPWHKGETCDDYDRRNKKRLKDEKASEDMIKKTSKKCPECKQEVHKYAGCNHITCVCGHEWCYICFAKFERNHVGFLFCRHNPGCTERDPFIDLIDNPPAPLDVNRNMNMPQVDPVFPVVFPPMPRNNQHLRPGRQRQMQQARPPPPPPPPQAAPRGQLAGFIPPPQQQQVWGLFNGPRNVAGFAQPPPPPGARRGPPPPPPQVQQQPPAFIGAVNVLTDQVNDLVNGLHNAAHAAHVNTRHIVMGPPGINGAAQVHAAQHAQHLALAQGIHGLRQTARTLDELRMGFQHPPPPPPPPRWGPGP